MDSNAPLTKGKSSMGQPIDESALGTLFREARTFTTWQPRPVDDQTLRDLYELLKWAPTSANAAPARFAFLRSKEAERYEPFEGDGFNLTIELVNGDGSRTTNTGRGHYDRKDYPARTARTARTAGTP